MMAAQKRGREGAPVPTRSEVWVEEFEHQLLQPRFIESLEVYARLRARLVARYRNVGDSYAAELVQDIIEDTFEGVLAWDPARVDLRGHVRGAIKSRSRHDYLRARRHRLQTLDPDEPHIAVELAEREASGQERNELRRRASAIIEALRALAVDDHEVLQLLDAYEQGAIKRIDALQLTGLTTRQYKAARERLTRLRESLPNYLQPTH